MPLGPLLLELLELELELELLDELEELDVL
jgi:hypothetical protein